MRGIAFRVIAGLLMILFSAQATVCAWPGDRKKIVDRNKDGVVDNKEKAQAKKAAVRKKHKVNTALEAKYDANGDGWLQTPEINNVLRDKQALIKAHGKSKVDSTVEQEYDLDEDGWLDADEAALMIEDAKE